MIAGRLHHQQGARADAAHHLGHGVRLLAQRHGRGVRRPRQQGDIEIVYLVLETHIAVLIFSHDIS